MTKRLITILALVALAGSVSACAKILGLESKGDTPQGPFDLATLASLAVATLAEGVDGGKTVKDVAALDGAGRGPLAAADLCTFKSRTGGAGGSH